MKTVVWNELSAGERAAFLRRPASESKAGVGRAVQSVVADVFARGDGALLDYTKKFDGADLSAVGLMVPAEKIAATPEEIRDTYHVLRTAYNNIRTYHEKQGAREYEIETMPGVKCRRIVRPIERVGLYVPGGSAPLVSTALMLGVPAQLAGCKEIIMCTPCGKDGEVNPHILAAAQLCGIEKIYSIGGAQAIAAMAYGTQSVPKVEKIFGPGNAYVTAAKQMVALDPDGAALDMPAGPSEVLVVADDTTDEVFAAADLLSQAEHDPLSQVILVALSAEKAQAIMAETQAQLEKLPRKEIAAAALENSSCLIAADMNQALEISNLYAPEHLILGFDGAEAYVDRVENAGSVFVGPWSCESAGDYASGPNHALPTYGYARAYSGLSVEAFQRTMSVQELSRDGLEALGDTIETLAGIEGLDAHANAVRVRRGK